jgi:hypothetical protein
VWTTDVTPAQVTTLTAPDLWPHLPSVAAMAVAGLVIWRWSAPRPGARAV